MYPSLRLRSTRLLVLVLASWALAPGALRANHLECNHSLGTASPIQILGAWHCGSTFCDWRAARDMAEFDSKNRWLVDRGDGTPSVNLVVLSFVHPMRLLNRTTDTVTLNGVPRGMTLDVVNYFKSAGVRVMMSIGGITYTEAWNEALATNATQLGLNAADVATFYGVGIEIDYEQNTSPNLAGLQQFIDAYRSVHPYDATGSDHAARLTIDLGPGNRWLQELSRHASIHWLDPANPVLDYANAMVPGNGQPRDVCNWVEHVNGILEFNPPIPPKAPARSPAPCGSTARTPSARASTARRTPLASSPTSSPAYGRRGGERRTAWPATCTGRPSARRRGRPARRRPTPVKAGSASRAPP